MSRCPDVAITDHNVTSDADTDFRTVPHLEICLLPNCLGVELGPRHRGDDPDEPTLGPGSGPKPVTQPLKPAWGLRTWGSRNLG